MHSATEKILKAALSADGEVSAEQIASAFAILQGKKPSIEHQDSLPILVNQATAARLLSASRFTVRRLVAEGRLRPIALTPDCVRYSRAELEKLGRGGG